MGGHRPVPAGLGLGPVSGIHPSRRSGIRPGARPASPARALAGHRGPGPRADGRAGAQPGAPDRRPQTGHPGGQAADQAGLLLPRVGAPARHGAVLRIGAGDQADRRGHPAHASRRHQPAVAGDGRRVERLLPAAVLPPGPGHRRRDRAARPSGSRAGGRTGAPAGALGGAGRAAVGLDRHSRRGTRPGREPPARRRSKSWNPSCAGRSINWWPRRGSGPARCAARRTRVEDCSPMRRFPWPASAKAGPPGAVVVGIVLPTRLAGNLEAHRSRRRRVQAVPGAAPGPGPALHSR